MASNQPLYRVTVTIEDRPNGKPIVTMATSPELNPAHQSPAMATWLLMRNALAPVASKLLPSTPTSKTPKKGRSHGPKSR